MICKLAYLYKIKCFISSAKEARQVKDYGTKVYLKVFFSDKSVCMYMETGLPNISFKGYSKEDNPVLCGKVY